MVRKELGCVQGEKVSVLKHMPGVFLQHLHCGNRCRVSRIEVEAHVPHDVAIRPATAFQPFLADSSPKLQVDRHGQDWLAFIALHAP